MSIQTDIPGEWVNKRVQMLSAQLRTVRLTTLTWLRSDEHFGQRSGAAITAVAALHVVFLGFIVWGLRLSDVPQNPRELQVSFYGPQQPVIRPLAAPPPDVPVVQPPDIVVADDTATLEVLAAPPSSVLAPRPDPAHPNPIPSAAVLGIVVGKQAVVILRLIVSSEGAVLQASVVQSSGQNVLDAAIETFVKEKWRFLPAMLNGGAIQYATTMAVPLSAGG